MPTVEDRGGGSPRSAVGAAPAGAPRWREQVTAMASASSTSSRSASARRARTPWARCGPPGAFATRLARRRAARRVARVRAELFGSLGATGHGHGSDRRRAARAGGEPPGDRRPATQVDALAGRGRAAGPACCAARAAPGRLRRRRRPRAAPAHDAALPPERDALHGARRRDGERCCAAATYYSVGGGFVVDEDGDGRDRDGRRRHRRAAATRSAPARNCSRSAPRRACRSAA